MHSQPFARAQPSLVRNGSERSSEAAPETGGSNVTERIREGNKVDVSVSDFDVFCKGSPLSESGLGVVIANLRMSAATLIAGATAAAEGDSDALAGTPLVDVAAHSNDDTGKFVAWDVRQVDITVVSHPAVPVAAAESTAFDFKHGGIRARRWIGNCLDDERSLE